MSSRSAAKVVALRLKSNMADMLIFRHVLCTQEWGQDGSLSQESTVDGGRLGGVRKSEDFCCFTILSVSVSRSPSLAQSKKGSLTTTTPIKTTNVAPFAEYLWPARVQCVQTVRSSAQLCSAPPQ